MAALILIVPTAAFDVWLAVTVGKRTVGRWIQSRSWSRLAGLLGSALALSVCCTAVIHYQWSAKTRVTGFPVPVSFLNLEDKVWVRSRPPAPWLYLGLATDLMTGLVLPLVPIKSAEFLRVVKEELNR